MNMTTDPEPKTSDATLHESIRAYFRDDRSRMTMMAARKFDVPEQAVVEALVGHWPIVRLRDGVFREVMEALPALGTMRVFVRSRAAVIESVGDFGGFSETGPFFNVQTDTLDMHILHAEIGADLRRREVGGTTPTSPPTRSSSSTAPATPPSRRSSGRTSPTSPPGRSRRSRN